MSADDQQADQDEYGCSYCPKTFETAAARTSHEQSHQASTVPMHSEIKDEPLPTLRRCDIRLRIAKKVGLNTNVETPFSKLEVNSIHAYLVGEHIFPKWKYRTPESPPIGNLRVWLAREIEYEDYTMTTAAQEAVDAEEARPFHKAGLIALCRAVEDQNDKRGRPSHD